MNLYLVRHAEAKPQEVDAQRPLSDKGRADIEKVGAFLSAHTTAKVDRILHSGKTRAQQTAEVLARHLRAEQKVSATDDLGPNADPSIWVKRLDRETSDLMVVGHLPYMDRLCATLVTGDDATSVVAFQMGAVVCLTRDDSGRWVVSWMVTPAMLK
ncbi:MAG TPA: phosphohistidine phosphatase SixA [Candidatus Deferrimicrobium sp.]|nr:phosphohistidine phosphatase SixA [Candidatus Deferrimicrobium sp.]